MQCFVKSKENKKRRKHEELLSRKIQNDLRILNGTNTTTPQIIQRIRHGKKKYQVFSHFPPEQEKDSINSAPSSQFLSEETSRFFSLSGDLILKKYINSIHQARSCVDCGFRDWVQGDVCYLMTLENDSEKLEYNKLLWLCPECALDHGMPKEYYQPTRNRLRPLPDPVNEIALHRQLPVMPQEEDIEWLQHYHSNVKNRKPQNWPSQYTDYYVEKQRQQRVEQCSNAICQAAVMVSPSTDHQDLSTYISGCTEETTTSTITSVSNDEQPSCVYVPSYDHDTIEDACYTYFAD